MKNDWADVFLPFFGNAVAKGIQCVTKPSSQKRLVLLIGECLVPESLRIGEHSIANTGK